jgi:GT2 family glycosyltransferase
VIRDELGAIDVVVPASNEEALLPACLKSVIAQRGVGAVNVIVVANGCDDRTVTAAEGLRETASAAGHRLTVLELEQAGKAAALNTADALLLGRIHVYLDADVVLTSGALAGLLAALAGEEPRMASPSPSPLMPVGGLARRYAKVWSTLPAVAGELTGSGCYAVNSAGRRRWQSLPDVIADDAFVRARFTRKERTLVRDEHFVYAFPDGSDLPGVLARWRQGNVQIAQLWPAYDPRATLRRSLSMLATRPSVWMDLPAFAAVSGAVRMRQARGPAWPCASRPGPSVASALPPRPSVSAVIVTHDSANEIETCLEALRVALEGLPYHLIVVDNASTDATTDIVSRYGNAITLHRNSNNAGFAAAANRGAAECDTDFVLLVNPDAAVDRHAVDTLLAVARRFPEAGIYGGQAILPNGSHDPFSRLQAPTLPSALGFAIGLRALRWRSALRTRSERHQPMDHVNAVEALCGAFLLITTAVWRELGGFDELFVMYGEDVDFCQRALRRSYTPLQATAARYLHVGGVSFSHAERHQLLLTAESTLYRRYLGAWRARIALTAMTAGTAIRAGVAAVTTSHKTAVWPAVWRERKRWRSGWTRRSRQAHSFRDERRTPA